MSDQSMAPMAPRTISLAHALIAGAGLLALGLVIGLLIGESAAPTAAATLINRADDAAPPLPQVLRPDPDRSAFLERSNVLQSMGPLNRTDPLQRTGPINGTIAWNAPGVQPAETAALVRDWAVAPEGWEAVNNTVVNTLRQGPATPSVLAQLVSAVTAVTPASPPPAGGFAGPGTVQVPTVLPPTVYDPTQRASPN